MAPVLRLLVVVRVEVQVVEDHRVGRRQVDAQAPRPGRQNEDEDFRVLVELVYQILAVLHRGLAVQAEVPMTPDLEILLHDVHHHGELREDEDPVSVTLHHRQHVVQ